MVDVEAGAAETEVDPDRDVGVDVAGADPGEGADPQGDRSLDPAPSDLSSISLIQILLYKTTLFCVLCQRSLPNYLFFFQNAKM